MTLEKHLAQQEAIAKAEDTQNLLEHIAWTNIVEPKLNEIKEIHQRMLVAAVLGQRVFVPTTGAGPQEISAEQIAGKIYGISTISEIFRDVLRRGERALRDISLNPYIG